MNIDAVSPGGATALPLRHGPESPIPNPLGPGGESQDPQRAAARPPSTLSESSRHESRDLRLRLDSATQRIVVQILDADNQVVRQIPAEEALRIAARYRELVGILFDRRI